MKDPLARAREEKERLIKLRDGSVETDETVNQDQVDGGNTEQAPNVDENTNEQTNQDSGQNTELKTEDDTFKHKYDVLLGKYNAEVPRLHAQVRDLTQENSVLKSQMMDLKNKPAPVDIPPLQDRDDEGNILYRSPYVTDEMRASSAYRFMFKEYGQNYAENHFEANVLTTQNTVKPVQEQMAEVSNMTEQDRFEMALDGSVPSWRKTNIDPEFMAWLQNAAPGTGTSYHQLVNDAYNSRDLQRTAEIFELFEELNKKPAPPVTPTIPPHLQVPNRTGGGNQTVIDNAQGKVLRMTDFQKLYDDHREGKYQGKEKEYQEKKREFMTAQAEGRLIP